MILLLAASLALANVGEARRGWRPELPEPTHSALSDDGRFRLHWSDDIAYRPDGWRPDAVPTAVDDVLTAFAEAEPFWAARGYVAVSGDSGGGGDDALDVYFLPLDANGYAYPLRSTAPDGGAACYIELDNGLSGSVLRSVAQHELNHCVQFRYTVRSPNWVHEATATWEQYLLAGPALDIGLQVLYATRLSQPERPLDDRGGRFEYAGFTLFRHLEQEAGGRALTRRMWEELAQEPDALLALERLTRGELDRDLEQWFADFSADQAFACGRAPELDAGPAPCTSPEVLPLATLIRDEPVDIDLLEVPYTAWAAELGADGEAVSLTCDAPTSGRYLLTARGVSEDGFAEQQVRMGPLTDAGTLNTGWAVPPGGLRVIVTSVGDEPLHLRCTARTVAPVSYDTGTCQHGPTAPRSALLLALIGWFRRSRRARRRR